jgi:hypothetical protein
MMIRLAIVSILVLGLSALDAFAVEKNRASAGVSAAQERERLTKPSAQRQPTLIACSQ